MRLYRSFLLALMMLILGCATTRQMPPPLTPQPLTSFEVKFTPENAEKYPPTTSDPYPPSRMSYAFPNGVKKIVRDEKISQPYIKIGEMIFAENWYDDETIAKLTRFHVPKVGGDAISSYHMQQQSAAVMKDSATGNFRNLYYGTIYLELIRYTKSRDRN